MIFHGVGHSFRGAVLCLVIALSLGAEEKAGTDAAAIAGAIKELGSADWKDRRDAEQQLVDFGDTSAAVIQQVLPETKDAEVRTHLESALRRIDQNNRIGPTSVSLHLKESAAQDAFAALDDASKGALPPEPENLFDQGLWQIADVDVTRRPYWEVVRLMCRKFGVEPRGMDAGLRLTRAGDGHDEFDGPAVIDGPFLIVANALYRNVAIHLGDPAGPAANANAPSDDFDLQLTAFAEPKLTVLRCDEAVTLEEAADDKGHSLLPPQGAAGTQLISSGKGAWTLHAQMVYPAEQPGRRITRLKGSIGFLLRTKVQKVEVADVLTVREAHERVGDLPMTIKDFKRAGDRYELRLSLALDVLKEKNWEGVQQSMQSDLRIFDDAGHPLIARGFRSRASETNNDEVEFILGYVRENTGDASVDPPIGEPSKLIWDVPVETERCVAHFDFKDLPMP